jgi:hypothetical protein
MAQPPMGQPQAAAAGKSQFNKFMIITGIALVGFVVLLKVWMGPSLGDVMKDSIKEGMKASSATTATKEAAPAANVDAIVISAKKLYEEYDENEPAADEKYKGKVLEVTGPIKSIDKDYFDSINLELETGQILSGVTAKLAPSEKSKATTLKKKQQVSVRCRGKGRLLTSAMLEDCKIIPSPTAAAPAAE